MKLYTLEACEKLINYYTEKNGNIETIRKGSLGLGTMVLTAANMRTAIIKEIYLNEWSSGHTVKLYRETPKKYLHGL